MECEYCNHVFKTSSSLKLHKKTAKYCLAKQNISPVEEYICTFCNISFTLKSSLHKHLRICKANTPLVREQLHLLDEKSNELSSLKTQLDLFIIREKEIISNYDKKLKENNIKNNKKLSDKDKIIYEKDLLISEQKNIIKELQTEYKKHIEMQNKDLQDRMQSMAEKAIDKPSTLNQNTINQIINNLLPITTEHLNNQAQYLTIDHVKNGALGYAKYALEHPLKDRLVCTDTSRKKGKYKDSDGNIVSDPEMSSITKKLFLAIKDRNSELITEYANDLKVKLDSFGSDNNEMTNEETVEITGMTDDLIDLVTSVFSQKRQSNEISDGLKPELFHQFVKEISSGSYRSN